MKRSIKVRAKGGAKRDQFAELSEGMEALADALACTQRHEFVAFASPAAHLRELPFLRSVPRTDHA